MKRRQTQLITSAFVKKEPRYVSFVDFNVPSNNFSSTNRSTKIKFIVKYLKTDKISHMYIV